MSESADAALTDLGFTQTGQVWTHAGLLCGERTFRMDVELPREFPSALPIIKVPRKDLAEPLPHVELSGKVCLAPTSGILLDASRPGRIVRDAVARAVVILSEENRESIRRAFHEEFSAYWDKANQGHLFLNGMLACKSRPLIALGGVNNKTSEIFVAERREECQWLATRFGIDRGSQLNVYCLKLQASFPPLDGGDKPTVEWLLDILESRAAAVDFAHFWQWLQNVGFPSYVVMSMPAIETGSILACARLPSPHDGPATGITKGFRQGSAIPFELALRAIKKLPIGRPRCLRLDREFALSRVGGDTTLLNRRIAIVGLGAIGGHLPAMLARAGAGELRLIDDDVLSPDNAMRHELGYFGLLKNKVDALKSLLGSTYPELLVQTRAERVENTLTENPDWVMGVEALIFATGAETSELAANDKIGRGVNRLHVWIEPLGLGWHVLAIPKGVPGCYRCLFAHDAERGFFNMASLALPGQNFQRSVAGCPGTFTPFGDLDATQAALECCRIVRRVINGEIGSTTLLSWRGDPTLFQHAGLKLSIRGEEACRAGLLQESISNSQCTVCQAAAS